MLLVIILIKTIKNNKKGNNHIKNNDINNTINKDNKNS